MHDPLVLIAAAVIGLIFGSFFSMLSWRLPRRLLAEYHGEPVQPLWDLRTRSACPHCQTTLPWYRLIPLFSWLFSRGRCHACRQPISVRYPLIELATATLTVAAIWQFGLTAQGAFAVAFGWLVVLLVTVDLEHKLLLDVFTYPLLWLGLLANSLHLWVSPEAAIWGAVLGYGLLWSTYWLFKLATGREGMGYGDFKMMAAVGAWFGWSAIPGLLLLSALSGIVVQLLLRLLGRGETRFAFGPYIGLAGLAWLFFGPQLSRVF